MKPYLITITVPIPAKSDKHADSIMRRLLDALGKYGYTAHASFEEQDDRAANDHPVDFKLDINCMYEDHGALYGYVTIDGWIAIRPCDRCLADNSRQADDRWKKSLAEAIG